MSSPNGTALHVNGLHVAYERDIEILRGVDLVARSAQITAVIGPNGAGKSTLLRGVAGLAPVVGGTVRLGERDVTGTSTEQLLHAGLAFVPQEHTVFPEMTVAENLRLGGWSRRHEREWLTRRIDACCQLFPFLSARLHSPAGALSGGQQRLLEVARCLVVEPSVLLLDEPTAGLSPAMTADVYEQIDELHEQADVTILLVDQNVREALHLADHVYVLAMGQNDTDGTAKDVQARLDDIVRGWMGRKGSGADI
ncbi:MAG: ABC transporter ATP-binding protein [Gammaproteobacteria bacterium]|nr:ABC transporter ATP-binding protein [Gammaproteobacteria bacterium]NIR82935.1 ABC transporter ATP-binding protein [Gammaproteobacteria bacterium]NIR90204.1 ABC transporter ATP-binding protein [Gammaproteobacteria bacterium]NIU04081.1 ABC transporter ATP-binding protein [Gammaproteobacteria bacterium]NIV51070.1 ATP-binding cassette domain-containing protein [Gammaproteobacteria bacterium]